MERLRPFGAIFPLICLPNLAFIGLSVCKVEQLQHCAVDDSHCNTDVTLILSGFHLSQDFILKKKSTLNTSGPASCCALLCF
jgi:hypothetical protein